MSDLRGRSIIGTFYHAPVRVAVETLDATLLRIDEDGIIAARFDPSDAGYGEAVAAAEAAGTLVRVPDTSMILPGFIDLHIHAPQYPQLGSALDRPLERWLEDFTFPLEARYVDPDFARRVYTALVEDLLAQGTTTAVMFATIHLEATQILVDICLEKGLRALIGKVAMDDPSICPDYYRDASAQDALEQTDAFIAYVRGRSDNAHALVQPVVTPRFIPSCTDELLEGLGKIAERCGCHIQTHCSESDWQDDYVHARTALRDTAALDHWGLLTPKTVLAHGVLLNAGDMELIVEREAAVAHCPLSNVYFSNAVFPLRAALEKGLKVGLGTDIAGGPSASMFDTIRMTVTASRMLDEGVDPAQPPAIRRRPGTRQDWRTAFYLATAGGGEALGLSVGAFLPGQAFDAQLIDLEARDGTIRVWDRANDPDILLEKVLFTASRANIARTWVGGRCVADREAQPSRVRA